MSARRDSILRDRQNAPRFFGCASFDISRIEWWGPKWCDTPMHCVNYLFRQGREHKYAYDEETLHRVLHAAQGVAPPAVEIQRRLG